MGREGSNPLPSAVVPMVKWMIMARFERVVPGSSPGRGIVLVQVCGCAVFLIRKGKPTGDGNRLENGRAMSLGGSTPPLSAGGREAWGVPRRLAASMVSVV